MKLNIKERLDNYRRVLAISKKPSKDDFMYTSRICGIGLLIVGIVGLVLYALAILVGL